MVAVVELGRSSTRTDTAEDLPAAGTERESLSRGAVERVNRLSLECGATEAKRSKPTVCIQGLPELLSIQTPNNVSLRPTVEIVMNGFFCRPRSITPRTQAYCRHALHPLIPDDAARLCKA